MRVSAVIFMLTLVLVPVANAGPSIPEMVTISGGTFRMGSSAYAERPVHTVTIQPFSLGKYEVTFEQYDAFARATGRPLPADEGWGRGRRPVINVTWIDAVAYTEWLSGRTGTRYRLPTEAEWEYACRAGTTTARWWGNEVGKNRANFDRSGSEWSGKQTSPVDAFEPNPFGLHDMLGNVFEWTQDCWHENYNGAPMDGAAWLEADGGDCECRVVRGGSWSFKSVFARSAARYDGYHFPYGRFNGLGFRVVCALPVSAR